MLKIFQIIFLRTCILEHIISFLLEIAVIQTDFRIGLFLENLAECPRIHKNTFISHVTTGSVEGILSAACMKDHEAQTGQPYNTANMSSLLRDVNIGMKPGGHSARTLPSLH